MAGLRLAIVDQDHLSDDLLGVGFSDDHGFFRISFHLSEFNQELLERELNPDIYVVFSRHHEGKYRPFARRDFGHRRFADRVLELGTIEINPAATELEAKELVATPGLDKRVARLSLDNELMEHCVREVTPIVAHWTGWPDLLDRVNIGVVDNLGPRLVASFEAGGIDTDFAPSSIVARAISASAFAVYEPFGQEILINADACRENSLDGMKVILGHELIHAGQFLFYDDVLPAYRENLNDLFSRAREFIESPETDLDSFWDLIERSDLQQQMRELEGYAFYIQKDFLEQWYNCALLIPHHSIWSRLIRGLANMITDDLKTAEEIKLRQYIEGRHDFRNRQVGGRPIQFRAD